MAGCVAYFAEAMIVIAVGCLDVGPLQKFFFFKKKLMFRTTSHLIGIVLGILHFSLSGRERFNYYENL